jgi:hypothetical protein
VCGVGAALALGAIGLFSGPGCQSPSGLFCQQQSDCSSGLVCSKPPGVSATSYGVCSPARRGLGEICVYNSDCDEGLRCASDSVSPNDLRHGICQPTGSSDGGLGDAGLGDLSRPADSGAVDQLAGG